MGNSGAIRDPLTYEIIGAAIEVHRALGPGMLESAYQECMGHELTLRNILFAREVPLPLVYKGTRLNAIYKLDLLVADTVVVELKTVDHVLPVHEAQLLSYMRLSGKRVGLLINFHAPVINDGIKRMLL